MNGLDSELQIVRQEITELYRPAVERIVKKVEKSLLTVITGFSGDGKSTTLLPLLAQALTKKGFKSYLCGGEYRESGSILGNSEEFAASLPATNNGVLILDEAGDIFDADNPGATVLQARSILQIAHDRNYRMLSSLAFCANDTTNIRPATKAWQLAEQGWSGKLAPAIHPPPFRLDPPLARRLLEAVLEVENYQVQKEHVGYLLENIPGHLRILAENAPRSLRSYAGKSLRQFVLELEFQTGKDGNWGLMLTPDEVKTVREQLFKSLS